MNAVDSDAEAVVALLPWGDLAEDFLDPIGITVETFATEMDGGWLFGYVEALRRAGVRAVIVCVSARVSEPARFLNRPTGATVWVLPELGLFRRLRSRMRDPMGWTVEAMFGPARGPRRAVHRLIRDTAPYLATPPRLLAQVLRRERCTAILCQEYEYPRFDVSVAVGRLLKLPVFATFQGGDWQTSRVERFVRPRAVRAAAGFTDPHRGRAERPTACRTGRSPRSSTRSTWWRGGCRRSPRRARRSASRARRRWSSGTDAWTSTGKASTCSSTRGRRSYVRIRTATFGCCW